MFRIDRNSVNLTKDKLENPDLIETEEEKSPPKPIFNEEEEIERVTKLTDELLRNAREEAADIVRNAEMAAVELKNEAETRGYADGKTKAESENFALYNERMAAGDKMVSRMLGEIALAKAEIVDGIEDEIVDFCLAIARKIVNVAIEKDDNVYMDLLKKALKQMKYEGKITVRVSDSEFERFFPKGSAAFVLGDESVTASVVSDPSLSSGGCVVESDGETINAGIDSQFRRIELAFGGAGRE